jgi:hypothetical protein
MNGKHIFITQSDLGRLQQLIDSSKGSRHRDKPQLDSLQVELRTETHLSRHIQKSRRAGRETQARQSGLR